MRLALVLCVLLFVVPSAVSAQSQVSGDILVANEVVLRIRAGTPRQSVAERTRIVTQRLVDILSYEDTVTPNVKIATKKGAPAIYVGKTLLVTVQQADARANRTKPRGLARLWAKNVARQLPKATPLSKLPGFKPKELAE